MSFKDATPHFQMLNVSLIEPDPQQPRREIDEAGLKGLTHSIQRKGLIHPLIVQPANAAGKYTLIVGERRWRAAVMAGETTAPALIHPCDPDEALEIQVFENLGLGMRAPIEARDMANAIQTIANRFETRESAAEHFGRNSSWLNQATAAANLSEKVTALLDSGKISSTGAAVQLEKLAQKNEAKAESIIDQIEQLPEGTKLSKKVVDSVLSEEAPRRKKKEEQVEAILATTPPPAPGAPMSGEEQVPPWEDIPSTPAPLQRQVSPSKVERVAKILGLDDSNEAEILERLIDEFLALKEGNSPF
ncbi:ParB/RepB/Spo0J family partition protein [Propionivibrio limicola]|uniref:ParB/RepB/Spo0J family partition protein n=1 Tax=Propionivibrio limicola TaxID=167645 RepID=UPI00129259F9|nr:ParB/RepB/Spo0J family partition protein [Propionivibrio limicola]